MDALVWVIVILVLFIALALFALIAYSIVKNSMKDLKGKDLNSLWDTGNTLSEMVLSNQLNFKKFMVEYYNLEIRKIDRTLKYTKDPKEIAELKAERESFKTKLTNIQELGE
jgi:hypothetical protein